mmetsp:Transcript_42340/g.165284  ORF Transcript_42340/g.165284 Transcript_42340/m.165284 type:complete len:84 (+) Transcript_42340:975-1226(+)
MLLVDPELLRESRKFFGDVFRTDPVYEAASKSGMEVVSSPEFQSKGLETIRKALYSDEFKSAGYEFGKMEVFEMPVSFRSKRF